MLSKRVASGALRPVAERIGQDPLVLEPLQAIGRYGGTLRRAFTGPGDWWGIVRAAAGPDSLLFWDKDWRNVRPNIARDFAFSADYRELTLFLRRGMRWSDGAPFTADDVLFWYEDLYLDRRVVAAPTSSLRVDDQDVVIRKVDSHTVQFVSPAPYEVLAEFLASATDLGGPAFYGRYGMGGYAPKHYLAQFHPKYSSEAEASRKAHEAGYLSWSIYLRNRNDWTLNPELPVLAPWRVVSPMNSQNFRLERNAFSIWVDTDGNQLPYIDRITNTLCAGADAVSFKAIAGQLDFQNRHLKIAQLPILVRNQRRGNYQVFLNPSEGTDLGIRINLHHLSDPEIGRWLQAVDFRRALSTGINRHDINEALMLGLGVPSASVPAPRNRFFPGFDWQEKWATYDPTLANRLLDDLGLTHRDTAGFRLRLDGRGRLRLTCVTAKSHFDYSAVAEMVREQWKGIGVDLDVQIVDQTLYMQRSMSGELQLAVMMTGSDDPFSYPDVLFPYTTVGVGAIMGLAYARWFQSNGKAGEQPPDDIVEIMNLWRAGRTAIGNDRIEIGKELTKRHVDLVLSIGLVSSAYSMHGVHLASNTLRNVPRRFVNTSLVLSPAPALPMTFYFDNGLRK